MMNYFAYDDYIGDWIDNREIVITESDIYDEVLIIRDNPEEFDFEIFDIIETALSRGCELNILEKLLGTSYNTAKLAKKANKLISKIRNSK